MIEGNAAHIGLVRRKRLQRTQVRGAFGQDDIAGIDERLRDKIERFLRTARNHDFGGLTAHPDIAHEIAEHLLRLHAAIGRTVLKGNGAIVFGCRPHGLLDGARWKQRHIGHAA